MCALVAISSSRISLTMSVHPRSTARKHGISRPAPGTGYTLSYDLLSRTDTRPFGRIKVHFKDSKGNLLKTVEGNEGDSLLDIAHEHDVDLEGVYPRVRPSRTDHLPVSSNVGACEGSVACSTCHVILTPEDYDLLPEPEDDENDMLDMAFGLTDTSVAFTLLPVQISFISLLSCVYDRFLTNHCRSRLGCQVKLTKELDGITATLPSATRNMFVDGEDTPRSLLR